MTARLTSVKKYKKCNQSCDNPVSLPKDAQIDFGNKWIWWLCKRHGFRLVKPYSESWKDLMDKLNQQKIMEEWFSNYDWNKP